MKPEELARALAALTPEELREVRECLQPGTFARRVMGAWWVLHDHANHLLSKDCVSQALDWKASAAPVEDLRRELAERDRELWLLRIVQHTAAQHIAAHGKIQVKDPLHSALANYYRFIVERAKAKQAESADEGKAHE